MAISPSGAVSTLVPDAPLRPTPEISTASRATEADTPSQAVTPPSTDTRIEPEPPRDNHVDVTV